MSIARLYVLHEALEKIHSLSVSSFLRIPNVLQLITPPSPFSNLKI